VDAILTPATPSAAFGIGEKGQADPIEMYLNDVFTVTVNMAACGDCGARRSRRAGPAVGCSSSGGVDEESLFSLGEVIEQAADASRRRAGGRPDASRRRAGGA